jgi:hypothetical protein
VLLLFWVAYSITNDNAVIYNMGCVYCNAMV